MKSIKLVSSKNFENFSKISIQIFQYKVNIPIFCHLHSKRQCKTAYQRYDKIQFWMEEEGQASIRKPRLPKSSSLTRLSFGTLCQMIFHSQHDINISLRVKLAGKYHLPIIKKDL